MIRTMKSAQKLMYAAAGVRQLRMPDVMPAMPTTQVGPSLFRCINISHLPNKSS